jgi:hypothetical protein
MDLEMPSEPLIIPEKPNQSKGLAAPWGMTQVLERTDFFRRKRRTAALWTARFLIGSRRRDMPFATRR